MNKPTGNIKERAIVWKQSKELGRCICSSPAFPFPCPCPYMLKNRICKCNNEKLPNGDTQETWAEYNIKNSNNE